MSDLPQLLRDAAGWLEDAQKAYALTAAADPVVMRQYVSEWQHAVDMCSQAIEDWWLMVSIDELTEREKSLRAAARTYSEAVARARDEEFW